MVDKDDDRKQPPKGTDQKLQDMARQQSRTNKQSNVRGGDDGSSKSVSATNLSDADSSAAASSSLPLFQRTRKDGRVFVPKNSLTEEMLIAERDRVRDKLKRKRKEDWTKEEIAEERRSVTRLSEFQSRSKWKKTIDDLKQASEEQSRQGAIQTQLISTLQTELQAVREENATLRRQLDMIFSAGGSLPAHQPIAVVPPTLHQSLGTFSTGLDQILLRLQAAESIMSQANQNQSRTFPIPPLSHLQQTGPNQWAVIAQILQSLQSQPERHTQQHGNSGGGAGHASPRDPGWNSKNEEDGSPKT